MPFSPVISEARLSLIPAKLPLLSFALSWAETFTSDEYDCIIETNFMNPFLVSMEAFFPCWKSAEDKLVTELDHVVMEFVTSSTKIRLEPITSNDTLLEYSATDVISVSCLTHRIRLTSERCMKCNNGSCFQCSCVCDRNVTTARFCVIPNNRKTSQKKAKEIWK